MQGKITTEDSRAARIHRFRKLRVPSRPLLRVQNLTVGIETQSGERARVIEDISFELGAGEVLGLLGESGAGKSTLALALLRVLPAAFCVESGAIEFIGRPLFSLAEDEMREIRGAHASLIYQDASVLNPVLRVVDQVAEVLHAHRGWTMENCRQEARATLEMVGLVGEHLARAYPHQLSGGQRQRVVIAQALACSPALVIADEPTASLDAEATREILKLFQYLRARLHTAFLLISHRPAVLETLTDRLLVMYGGRIIEEGPTHQVFHEPLHPYTRELLRCDLRNRDARDEGRENSKSRVPCIPGNAPDLLRPSAGCAFESRCPSRRAICQARRPVATTPSPEHKVFCFEYGGESQ